MAYEGLMVSVSGVRGRVGEALTPEIVAKFAAGFGAWARQRAGGKGRIVVGRDSRVSGPMFQPVVISALQTGGRDVNLFDKAPTPTNQLTLEQQHPAS
jgi:phosphomannomutase